MAALEGVPMAALEGVPMAALGSGARQERNREDLHRFAGFDLHAVPGRFVTESALFWHGFGTKCPGSLTVAARRFAGGIKR
jgi:hypothetical protein